MWTIEKVLSSQKPKKCIHFCQLQKRNNDPTLKINSPEIPLIQQHKFLGNIYTIHEDTENQTQQDNPAAECSGPY